MKICDLICKRKSCRAYTDQSVDKEMIRIILETARWAPSGVNHQPTQVAVLGPITRKKLSKILLNKYLSGVAPNPDYEYCHKSWSNPYQARRKACGNALYTSLGIKKDDHESRKTHKCRNYNFFDAPVGLIVFIEKHMPKGSWVDVGLFIQNILLTAEGLGLATCPQAIFVEYPDTVRQVLSLKNVDIVCGIALGYEDTTHPLNSYRTTREALENFSKWYD